MYQQLKYFKSTAYRSIGSAAQLVDRADWSIAHNRRMNDLRICYFLSTTDGKQQRFWALFSVRSGDFYTTFDRWSQSLLTETTTNSG